MIQNILLIDDDRLHFRLAQEHFARFRTGKFELEWASTYHDGLQRLVDGNYAACLLDYQLGERDGLALIREAMRMGCRVPIVFLTSDTSEGIDIEAMNAGALDYLVKGEINTRSLERSLLYALKLGETLDALQRLATRDALTGVLNRREFDRIVAEEEDHARRFGRTVALVLVDLDHFKKINDTHGHVVGDEILRACAQRIVEQVRDGDRVARYGGEEFAVLLTGVNAEDAENIAWRIVAAMANDPVILADGRDIKITLSAGSAVLPTNAADGKRLMRAADEALYKAKADGRNRAIAATGIV